MSKAPKAARARGVHRVAFQGELGAFSEEAVRALYGEAVVPVPLREFREAGEAVVEGRVEAAVLPVENSIAGSVGPAYDVLLSLPVRVVGEVVRPIRHCLLGVPGAALGGVRRAVSHPVALAQCTEFLRTRPGLEAVAVYDTAGAAREVAEAGDPAVTAIASRLAGERYGLEVLAADIQDRDDNQTRFYAVVAADAGAEPGPPGEERKTALVLETRNQPGALVAVLQSFAGHGINLTKLESRPGPEPWSYRFILELVSGDAEAEAAAVKDATAAAVSLRVLGRFPPWRPGA
ncbi:MAG TPA: prephenate dehydratase domain-containing protein [Longimicrobiales bacterium]|nr:prephenate dehydratase domain-containing protein [Longimicrobiales bacterium]